MPIKREVVGCSEAEGSMRPVDVVVLALVLGLDFGFQQRKDSLDGEEFAIE